MLSSTPAVGGAADRRLRVALEQGRRWVFASAVDWPGWCRRGKGEEAALEVLLGHADRYAAVAGPGFQPGTPEIIGRVPGNATTDFGAPDVPGPWDDEPLPAAEAGRLTGLLEASWACFDAVALAAPAVLRRGPRGGGRDRDEIARHVREAERSWCGKAGVRVPPRTPWEEQRAQLAAALRAGAPGGSWPARYLLRRCTWHVLDHAWEIEDKSS
jgi:hypothetical protein